MTGKATITFEVSEDKEGVNVQLSLGLEKENPEWDDLNEAQILAFSMMQMIKTQMARYIKDNGDSNEEADDEKMVSDIVKNALLEASKMSKH